MNYIFSPEKIRDEVLAFMREKGMYPAHERDCWLALDDRIHRYQIEGHKNGTTNGAYIIHTDGIPAAFIQDWSNPDAKYTWSMKGFKKSDMPDFDINKWNEQRATREAELHQKQAKAIDDAYEYYQKAFDGEIWHAYLDRKDVKAYGDVRLDNLTGHLLIPLRDIGGSFKAVQTIDRDGEKRFFYGTSFKGNFFPFGLDMLREGDNKPILVGEGYATMAKVFQLTDLPCVAAINCGNLESVITALRGRYGRPIILMADNDIATFNKRGFNPGIDTAKKLLNAKLIKGYAAPPFNLENPEGSDWDDYALKFGNTAARQAIIEGRNGLRVMLMSEKDRTSYINHLDIISLLGKLNPAVQLPPQEFIGGLFPRGFISSVVAPSGTGKTIFMQKAVSDLSIGGTFFDGVAEDEPPRKCLIFAAEAGYELLLRRGASFKWNINPDNVIVANQYSYESKGKSLMLDDPQGMENVRDIIKTVKPDIVFFDTFGSFHEKDENKSTDMKPILRYLTDIAREFYIAIVLNHHSRKRTSKERALMLSQDDVIGSSIFNRLVSLIIGIEPISDGEKILQVRPLKSWFRAFDIFTYKIGEDLYGHSVIETNLAPDDRNGGNSRIAVWNYLTDAFRPGEWFTASQIFLSEIEGDVSERQLKTVFQEFVRAGKLAKRGATSNTEYSLA